VAAAGRAQRRHTGRFIVCAVIDAGTRLEQLPHRRLLFRRGERWRIVVDAKLTHRGIQIDLSPSYGDANQRTEQTLARRIQQHI
jgi:hypothetical protein